MIQIYIGSFWGQAVANETNRKLYEYEQYRIFEDLSNLPKECLLRKVNYLAKRAREVSIHATIIAQLRERYRRQLSRFFADKRTKKHFIRRLPKIFAKIEQSQAVNKGDFPELAKLKTVLLRLNWNTFKRYSAHLTAQKESFINVDIPALVTRITDQRAANIFTLVDSPFGFEKGEGFDEGSLEERECWIVARHAQLYEPLFEELKGNNGKVTGKCPKVNPNHPNRT